VDVRDVRVMQCLSTLSRRRRLARPPAGYPPPGLMGAPALAPVIAEIRTSGITAPYAIAAALTARGVPTARGHRFWMVRQVHRLLDRLDRLSAVGNQLVESQESPPAAKRKLGKPVARKALLSRSALRSALRELS
jgi:hypothetical protein